MSDSFASDKTKFINDCVRGNDIESVQEALAAHPELLNAQDASGLTPFQNACFYGHPDMAAFLMEAKADTNALSSTKSTALHLAVSRGHLEAVRFLLKNTSIDVDAVDASGFTAENIAKTDDMYSLLKSRGYQATILMSNDDEDSD